MTKLTLILSLPALLCAQTLGSRVITIGVEVETFAGPALHKAERIATQMLAPAGIRARWINRVGSRSGSCADITVRLTDGASNSSGETGLHMAQAFPYSTGGVGIRIRWDKVAATAGRLIRPQSVLLAHVLVHEITHVLQGIARHSDEGIMRPFWTSGDLIEMYRAPLKFTPGDVGLIHLGWPRKVNGCPEPQSPGDKGGGGLVTAGFQYPLL